MTRSETRLKTRLRTTALLAALPVAALSLSACGSSADTAAASGDASSSLCPAGGLRFGVEPFEDPAKLTPAIEAVGKGLSDKLGCPVKVQVVQTYSAEVLAMQNGQLDIGVFGPLGYVFAEQRAKAEAVASFADSSGELSTYKAGVWVPANSPIQTLQDLKGKSLALGETGSTSGDALPRYALKKEGIAESDIKINYAGGHPQALLSLVNGKVDAAEINTQQQATATKAGTFDPSKYRQVWASDPIPTDPITVRGDLDPALKKAIADGLTSLPDDVVGQVGQYLDVEPGPLVPVTKDTYRQVFDLAATLGLTEKDA